MTITSLVSPNVNEVMLRIGFLKQAGDIWNFDLGEVVLSDISGPKINEPVDWVTLQKLAKSPRGSVYQGLYSRTTTKMCPFELSTSRKTQ